MKDDRFLNLIYPIFQAVIAAPCDKETGESKELSLVLANRSAVLFSLKAYPLALDDIKVAFEVGYPKELHFKLLERKVLHKETQGWQKIFKQTILGKNLDLLQATRFCQNCVPGTFEISGQCQGGLQEEAQDSERCPTDAGVL